MELTISSAHKNVRLKGICRKLRRFGSPISIHVPFPCAAVISCLVGDESSWAQLLLAENNIVPKMLMAT
jgi:hypothetical protein